MVKRKSSTAASCVEALCISMPVCWKQSSNNRICWSNAVAVEDRGDGNKIVRFNDGGWNHAENCFFSEEQCRKYYELPLQFAERNNEIASELETLVHSLRA